MGARIARRLLPGLAAVPLLPRRGRAATISLRAADGLSLTAEHLPAQGARRRGCILLFHMAGSNLGEYAPIAPELNRMGFETLALDQRSGGDGWGRRNETAARLGRDPGYRAALPDLEGALAWARARDPSGRVLAWGSSYSAAIWAGVRLGVSASRASSAAGPPLQAAAMASISAKGLIGGILAGKGWCGRSDSNRQGVAPGKF